MPESRPAKDSVPGGQGLLATPTVIPMTCARIAGLKDFHKLSTLVKPLLPEAGDRPIGGVTQQELERRWPRCAGPAAETSFPLLFRSGRLVVFTESAIWATELRHQRRGLEIALEDLGMTALDIKAIPRIFPPARTPPREVKLSKNNGHTLAVSAEGLTHAELKEAILRIAARGTNRRG